MIETFEHKIPFKLSTSFKMVLECGNTIPHWKLVQKDEVVGLIEWQQLFLLGLCMSKIRVYFKQQRPDYTLVTVYVNRPLQFIDPFKRVENVNRKLASKLSERIQI